jgi:hypothetical protein
MFDVGSLSVLLDALLPVSEAFEFAFEVRRFGCDVVGFGGFVVASSPPRCCPGAVLEILVVVSGVPPVRIAETGP